MPARRRLPRGRAGLPTLFGSWSAALVVLALAVTPALAAAPSLSGGSVSPTSGTLTTVFGFEVTYTSNPPKPALSIVAQLSSGSTSVEVAMSQVSGTDAANGTWRGSRSLPAGTWTVAFVATTSGPIATLTLTQPLTVVGPPTPTPVPTPPPTPTPVVTASPVPTPAPTPIAPTPLPSGAPTATPGSAEPSASGASASSEPSESATAGTSGSGTASASASGAPGGGSGGDGLEGQLTTFLTGGLAAIGLLAAVGFAAIYADRRRNRAAAGAARAGGLPGGGAAARPVAFPTPTAAPKPGRPPRRRAGWEDYALDDEPIGTVEYDPPTRD
jgi:hypothetical protein